MIVNNLNTWIKATNNIASVATNLKRPIHQGVTKRFAFISDEDIQEAERYYFSKCALNKDVSKEVNVILHYIGRIPSSEDVNIVGKATKIMNDLSMTFFVPIIDKNSLVEFSTVNNIHWHHSRALHSGVETTWRYVLQNIHN